MSRFSWVVSAVLLLLGSATGAAGQSLLSSRGLGLPLIASDARTMALGSIGIGLTGADLSVFDPTAPAELNLPAVAFSFQSSWAETDQDGVTGDFSGTRFPFLALGYPTGVGTVTLSIGSVLDQRWVAQSTEMIDLDGQGRMGRVTDRFESDGGVSSVRLGLARSVTEGISLGVQVGRNLGDVSRVFNRSFDSLDVDVPVPDFTGVGRWSYRGWTASVGASADVGSVLHVAGAYTWSGDLDALPDEDTDGVATSFGLPSEFRLGATALLSPQLRATGGIHRAAWSSVEADLRDGGARDVLAWGGGIEWSGASLLGKSSALRLGYRAAELPFTTDDAPDPRESAFTAGLGVDLLTSGEVLLARLDLALERGLREAGPFEERFWRLSTSVRVSGR